ncbi:hypothetical protein DVH24_021623 [Malus domestica]|uniref:Uncharacterized protein n=1 Tax=Malus domestica TaxID=3750 RepID=A0A498K3H8_MALDO|nr:hypothetical protein DVH24_021623 [Malus domestica]
MYPTPTETHDHEKYAAHHNHHHAHVPNPVSSAPGLNSPAGSVPTYAPPYIYTVQSNSVPAVPARGNWSTSLCHCCDDPENCMITFFCPCITFGQIAEIVSQGSTPCASGGVCYCILLSTTANACLYSCSYRSKMRAQYDLEETPCVDCLVHFCCATCALCQEYRELKNRGFDMGIAVNTEFVPPSTSSFLPLEHDPNSEGVQRPSVIVQTAYLG